MARASRLAAAKRPGVRLRGVVADRMGLPHVLDDMPLSLRGVPEKHQGIEG